MKKHMLIAVCLSALSTTIAVYSTNVSAGAKAVKMPSSLRGTWYHYDPSYDSYAKFHATKYHLTISDVNGISSYSGVKFPAYASGHPVLSVRKTPKGYYKISKYATDDERFFKRVTHKGHIALKEPWHEIPDTGTYVDYWYKTKAAAKSPSTRYKVAKANAFYFSKYTPAYLQADSGSQKAYTSSKNAEKKVGRFIILRSIYKKYSARWDDGNNNDVLRVKTNGKVYYLNLKKGQFQAYNSWKDGKVINSPYSPNSKAKIVMKHGTQYSNAKYWDKVIHYKNGLLVTDSWKRHSDGQWVKD